MGQNSMFEAKLISGDASYVLEDVPHSTDYIPDLATYSNPLRFNPAYSDVNPRGIHFQRAGPRQKIYFNSDEVCACIVTCGGLCPGLNTVCALYHMYGVKKVLGIDVLMSSINVVVQSLGHHEEGMIPQRVDGIQNHGINQVYIIGGDGTQKGAAASYEEIRRRGLKVAVAGIPETIDNDIPINDKSFDFDAAVEEAQRAINAAHVEAESGENGVGVVKLMGRYSDVNSYAPMDSLQMYATLASQGVDCSLIPESPFYLEGKGGLFEYMEEHLKENDHMVIVIAERAGQELLSESLQSGDQKDASGDRLLQDVGLWISHRIKDHFAKQRKMAITLKYMDPTYMIPAVPSNASDNVYCTLVAQSAVHGAMAGYTGFISGFVNGRHTYFPFNQITDRQRL